MKFSMMSSLAAVALLSVSTFAQAEPGTEQSKFEKDREAILAMAGEFRVSFDFAETVSMTEGYELKDSYSTGATEYVDVIEDTGEKIRLQHVLVLDPREEGGEPIVVKHWRQDWTFEDTSIAAFKGNRTWEHVDLSPSEVEGTWSQAVYQVDDSPRYEAIGAWTHEADRSAWLSAETWRPLPRREYTKRSDYQVMVAHNRHTITPTGWVHEQDNRKLVLDENGQPDHVIAHETGLNTYVRIDDHDFSAGRDYMKRTEAFWQDVRDYWDGKLAEPGRVTIKPKVDGERLGEKLFALADEVEGSGEHEAEIAKQIEAFLVEDDQPQASAAY